MIQPTAPVGKNQENSPPQETAPSQQTTRSQSGLDLVNQVLKEALGPYLAFMGVVPIPKFQYFGGNPVNGGKDSNGNDKSEGPNRETRATKAVAKILRNDNSQEAQNLLKNIKKNGLTEDEATKILRAGDKLTKKSIAQIVDVDLQKVE